MGLFTGVMIGENRLQEGDVRTTMNRAPRSPADRPRSLLALLGAAAFILVVGCTNGGGGATQPANAPAPAASAPAAQPPAAPSAAGGYNY